MKGHRKTAIYYESKDRSFFIGRTPKIIKRRYVSPTIVVSVEDEISLLDENRRTCYSGKSFLVTPESNIAFDTRNQKVGFLYLDDLGLELSQYRGQCHHTYDVQGHQVYEGIHCDSELAEKLTRIYESQYEAREAIDSVNSWIEGTTEDVSYGRDDRIAQVLAYIEKNIEQNLPASTYANQVHLSSSHLRELFKTVTGTSLRRYRQWKRIKRSANQVSQGNSLVETAIATGFSDYAHYSRVFKEMVGESPSRAIDFTDIRLV